MPTEHYHTEDGVAAVIHHAGLDPKEFGLDSPSKDTLHEVKSLLQPQGRRNTAIRDITNEDHLREDVEDLRNGVLDPNSFVQGYALQEHPVEYLVHDKDGTLKQRIHSHNVRTNVGGELQGLQLGGDANTQNGGSFAYTGTTATSLTGLTGLPTTATGTSPLLTGGLTGKIVYPSTGTGVFGIITNNTATAINVDKWHTPGTDATGTTPTSAAGTAYVLPAVAPFYYMALTNNSGGALTVSNVDTGNSAAWQTVSATAEVSGSAYWSTPTVAAGARAFTSLAASGSQPLSPRWFSGTGATNGASGNANDALPGAGGGGTTTTTNAGAFKLAVLFTAATAVLVQGSGLFNTAANLATGSNTPYAGAQGVLVFEASLGTAASLALGDTLTVTWQIQY